MYGGRNVLRGQVCVIESLCHWKIQKHCLGSACLLLWLIGPGKARSCLSWQWLVHGCSRSSVLNGSQTPHCPCESDADIMQNIWNVLATETARNISSGVRQGMPTPLPSIAALSSLPDLFSCVHLRAPSSIHAHAVNASSSLEG